MIDVGCDIHCLLEIRQADETWKLIKGYSSLARMYMEDKKQSIAEGNAEEAIRFEGIINRYKAEGLDRCWIFSDRNYELFALLADVRNYHEYPALFPKRGIPEDCSEDTKIEKEEWGPDAHSWTYFTLGDINAAVWEQAVRKTAMVKDSVWAEFCNTPEATTPRTYCEAVYGANDYHSRSWNRTYQEIAKRFFIKVVSRMEKLAKKNAFGEEGVRLVIFFDN
jgi:hypothetical protein